MKRFRKTIIVIFAPLLLLAFWISQPCNFNPFTSCPTSYSKSKITEQILENRVDNDILLSKIDSLVDKSIDEKDFLGMSLGVYIDGIGAITTNAGLSDKLFATATNDSTLFRIASLTKSMTAAAILRLSQDSIINLDDMINEHLPDLSFKHNISIEQLLNHTSGLPHYESNIKSMRFTGTASLLEASKTVSKLALLRKPGDGYSYSGYGYLLLGALIEQKSKMSYADYMKEHMWDKLKMNQTHAPNHSLPNESELFLRYKKMFLKSPPDNLSFKLAGGGVLSTSDDMIKYCRAILNYEVLDSMAINQVFEKREIEGNSDYVFGWHTDSTHHGRILYHGGALSGASSYIRIYLDKGIAIVCLSNSAFSNEETRYLSRNISKLLLSPNGIKTNIRSITNEPSQIEDWW